MRAVVIGAGGTSSHFTPMLIRALEFQAPGSAVIIIDGDSYEPKNAERQIFSKMGNKAAVMRNDNMEAAPNTIVIAKSAWVVAEGQGGQDEEGGVGRIAPSEFLQEGDHVFALVDNHAARKLLFDAAQNFDNIDVYTGGNGDDLTGSIYHYIRRDGADFSLHPAVMHEEFVNPPDRNPGSMSCEERAALEGGTQVSAANQGVSVHLLAKVAHYMLGTPEQRAASELITEVFFNLANASCESYDWLASPAEAPVAELVDA